MNECAEWMGDGVIRLLFLGDVMGEPGRKAVIHWLPILKAELALDFVVVNGENAAAGRGLTPKLAIALMRAGASVVTTGDHVWDQRELAPFFADEPRVLRPLNYPEGVPGAGFVVLDTPKGRVAVINALGRVFMGPQVDHPFYTVRQCVEQIREQTPVIFLDFHAEATSEKVAMGWYLDGLVSAVVGTHTHVPTADERVLPGGTAYLSDAGMCGPTHSVIGSDVEAVIGKFLDQMPRRFGIGDGPVRVNGAVVAIDAKSGRALGIERVVRYWEGDQLEEKKLPLEA
jgi:metallophosphoesterase (TIGR00282 family)